MAVRVFTGATMDEAMTQLRHTLGDEALIVECQEQAGQFQITAALPAPAQDATVPFKLKRLVDEAPLFQNVATADNLAKILAFHQAPPAIIQQIIERLPRTPNLTAEAALTQAMTPVFPWAGLAVHTHTDPIILIGPPGVGKTVTLVKLAVESLLAGRAVRLMTTDVFKTGAVEQLRQFAATLEVPFQVADAPAVCVQAVAQSQQANELLLIDTPGINPLLRSDVDWLQDYLRLIGGTILFTMAAGGDADECADLCACFRGLGAQMAIITKLDMTRRLPAVLTMMTILPIVRISTTPYVATALDVLNAPRLAKLLVSC